MRVKEQHLRASHMDDEMDISSTVTLLVKEHGQEAVGEAERRIVETSLEGNQEGFQFWISVKRAVLEYLGS